MKSTYMDEATRGILDLFAISHADSVGAWDSINPIWVISRIAVPENYRRKGIGTKLLTEVCSDADEEQVRLALFPRPYNANEFSLSALQSWYERFGFEYSVSRIWMLREPQHKGSTDV